MLAQVLLHDQLRKLPFLKKYVHVTTPEVYGSSDDWIREQLYFAPSKPYAVSRAACDLHLMSLFRAYRFPVVFTRSANVYGPGQQLYRIVPKAMLFARLGRKLNLHGGGHARDHLSQIVELELDGVRNRILESQADRQFILHCSDRVKDFFVEEGTDTRYGARHLKRVIERYLVFPLSNLIETEQIELGDVVHVDLNEEKKELTFAREASAAFVDSLDNVSHSPDLTEPTPRPSPESIQNVC